MTYELWEGSLHLSPEEAMAEGLDAQATLAAEGFAVGMVTVQEVVVGGELGGYQAVFAYAPEAGDLPGKARPWTFWLLVGSAGLGMVGGLVAAVVGSRRR